MGEACLWELYILTLTICIPHDDRNWYKKLCDCTPTYMLRYAQGYACTEITIPGNIEFITTIIGFHELLLWQVCFTLSALVSFMSRAFQPSSLIWATIPFCACISLNILFSRRRKGSSASLLHHHLRMCRRASGTHAQKRIVAMVVLHR